MFYLKFAVTGLLLLLTFTFTNQKPLKFVVNHKITGTPPESFKIISYEKPQTGGKRFIVVKIAFTKTYFKKYKYVFVIRLMRRSACRKETFIFHKIASSRPATIMGFRIEGKLNSHGSGNQYLVLTIPDGDDKVGFEFALTLYSMPIKKTGKPGGHPRIIFLIKQEAAVINGGKLILNRVNSADCSLVAIPILRPAGPSTYSLHIRSFLGDNIINRVRQIHSCYWYLNRKSNKIADTDKLSSKTSDHRFPGLRYKIDLKGLNVNAVQSHLLFPDVSRIVGNNVGVTLRVYLKVRSLKRKELDVILPIKWSTPPRPVVQTRPPPKPTRPPPKPTRPPRPVIRTKPPTRQTRPPPKPTRPPPKPTRPPPKPVIRTRKTPKPTKPTSRPTTRTRPTPRPTTKQTLKPSPRPVAQSKPQTRPEVITKSPSEESEEKKTKLSNSTIDKQKEIIKEKIGQFGDKVSVVATRMKNMKNLTPEKVNDSMMVIAGIAGAVFVLLTICGICCCNSKPKVKEITDEEKSEKIENEKSEQKQPTKDNKSADQKESKEKESTEDKRRERSSRERSTRERSMKERSSKERSSRERSTRERSMKERSSREKSKQERSSRERSTRERSSRERSSRQRSTRERRKQDRDEKKPKTQAKPKKKKIEDTDDDDDSDEDDESDHDEEDSDDDDD